MGTFLNPYRFAAPAGPTIYKGAFDGTGSPISAANPSYIGDTASGGRSIDLWVRPTSLPAVDGSHPVFAGGDAYAVSFGNFFRIRIQRQAANYTGWRFNIQARKGTSPTVSSRVYGSTSLSAGTWYHLTVTTNGSAWTMRVNGGAAETLTAVFGSNSGEWFGNLLDTAPAYALIGGEYANGSVNVYASDVEVRRVTLWDGALTATDAANLHAEGYNGDPTDATVTGATIAHSWDFTGQDTLDQVGSDDMAPSGAWDDSTDIIVST